jgi:hypothetical protein
MAFDLRSWMLRFLDIYQKDPDSIEQLLIDAEDAQADQGATSWDGATADVLRERTLIESDEVRREVEHLIACFPGIPEGAAETFESFKRSTFEILYQDPEFLNQLTEILGKTLGVNVSPEKVKGNEAFAQWLFERGQERSNRDREARSRAPVTSDRIAIHFAQQFAVGLNDMVSRAKSLENLEFADLVSNDLRELFQEAHHCYLHGRELSVAIICGAILEQALRDTLKSDCKLEKMLEDARERGILTWEQWGTADTVRQLRNLALHDQDEFRRWSASDKAALLFNTRAAVGNLLSKEQPGAANEGS